MHRLQMAQLWRSVVGGVCCFEIDDLLLEQYHQYESNYLTQHPKRPNDISGAPC